MNLSFSQKWLNRMGELAGKPNYFPIKILYGLEKNNIITEGCALEYQAKYQLGIDIEGFDIPDTLMNPKIHTLREDKNNRWKAGNKIHFVINNRTKDRFQFAPVIKCVNVQQIKIEYWRTDRYSKMINEIILPNKERVTVTVDGIILKKEQVEKLAINDGFPTMEAFFNWFNKSLFEGKIIHWTDLKY